MARREHQGLAGDLLAGGQHRGAYTSQLIEGHIRQLRLEAILGAPRLG